MEKEEKKEGSVPSDSSDGKAAAATEPQEAAAGAESGEGATEAKADEPASGAEAGEEAKAKTERESKPAEPDWKDMYVRLLADFDNFKKRTAREREDTYRFAEADLLRDILPFVDNLALALEKASDKEDAFVKGVQLVYDTLLKELKRHGAEPFDSVGQELDTGRMEAIATLPSEEVEEGKVSIESKKGWMLQEKVLRAAQVVVSSGKANNG